MNDFYRSTIESQRREISHLRTEQTRSNKRLKAYWVVGLAGWVLAVGALIWPVNAKASERHTATVVRCQQASDTCIKHESVFPDAEACEAANRQAVKAIGDTDDVVIAFCIGGEELDNPSTQEGEKQ